MIVLHGFPISNYYNKVKLVLLEKGLPFEEQRTMTGSTDEAVLACSPLAKIPYLRTPDGPLCESAVICEYLEELAPQPALMPAGAYARAKVRELITFMELHLELVARELYGQAFFGGTASESTKDRVGRALARNVPAFKRLAQFTPYVAGDTFTLADCSAYAALSAVGMASQQVLGSDALLAHGVDWKAHAKLLAQRPSVQKVAADRKLATEQMAAARAAKP